MGITKIFGNKDKIPDSKGINIGKIIDDFKIELEGKDDFNDESIDIEKLKIIKDRLYDIWTKLSDYSRNSNSKNMQLDDLFGYISRVNNIFSKLIFNNTYNQKDLISKSELYKVLFEKKYNDLKSLGDTIKYSIDSLVIFDESTNGSGKIVTNTLINEQVKEFNNTIFDILEELPEYYKEKGELSLKNIIIKDLEFFSNSFYDLSNKNGELEKLINEINENI